MKACKQRVGMEPCAKIQLTEQFRVVIEDGHDGLWTSEDPYSKRAALILMMTRDPPPPPLPPLIVCLNAPQTLSLAPEKVPSKCKHNMHDGV